jgi:hypothetical protein
MNYLENALVASDPEDIERNKTPVHPVPVMAYVRIHEQHAGRFGE